jgi:acetyltransferase-like isoleucine patch superfamily enzyme
MNEQLDMREYYRTKVRGRYFRAILRKTCQFLARYVFSNSLRIALFRLMGVKIGRNVYIGQDCYIDSDYAEFITIEDGAMISFRVIIVAHDAIREIISPIVIKKKSRIAAGAIVLAGVVVGENSVVGAGAVAGSDVPDGTAMLGNPGRIVSKRI